MRVTSLPRPAAITKSKYGGGNRANWTYWTFWNIGLQAILETFYKYFCYLYLSETKSFVLKTELNFKIFLIWFEFAFGVTVLKILCFWCFFYMVFGSLGFISYSRYILLGITVKLVLYETSTNTYFRDYEVHYIAKTQSIRYAI